MGVDLESGRIGVLLSADGTLEEADEDGDEKTEDDPGRHSPMNGVNKEPCLCQQFERRNFLRRLETEAIVEFQWMTFYKELVYHVFFPLSLPLIYWFEGGSTGIINRQYWGSRLALGQWSLAFSFYAMNILAAFYVAPDIIITNMLIVMRHMVLATKYGFYTKSDMAEMRERVLSKENLDDRTLLIAWLNPIPLRILKRQLLLAAIRNNMVKCTASLRVVPGASRHTLQEIMHQLTHEKRRNFMRSGRVKSHKSHKSSKVDTENCAICVRNSTTDKELEDRWIQLCMSRIHHDPKCHLPESGETSPEEDTKHGGRVEEADEAGSDGSTVKEKTMSDEVDIPALMLAAYLLQHSNYLLTKKKCGHQLLKNPMRAWCAAWGVASIHTVIPFAIRAITGQPAAWGGNAWYAYVVSISVILLNLSSMSSSVSFMIAGVADFRRRYFAARLLNSLLKDGVIGTDALQQDVVEPELRTLEQERRELRQKSEYHIGMAVNYGKASSIVGWWIMRTLVQDFGLVFSRRVKYYASYFCVYCGLLLAYLVIALFTVGTRASAYIMAVVIFDLIIFIGLLALIVSPGGETNAMHLLHGATLVYKKMEIANALRGPLDSVPAQEREPYVFALEVMQTVSECLHWDNTITKVTILGFKAGSEMIGVLLGFGGAAIGIAAQQFTAYIGSSH